MVITIVLIYVTAQVNVVSILPPGNVIIDYEMYGTTGGCGY